ncbi:MAG: 50S ribosomal protein L4 [Chloroflexi bacterium]|nr:50S ribosomal protein L4 [Chloroflexota bacterium]
MKLPVRTPQGEVLREQELPAGLFGVASSSGLAHQALMRQLADQRLGTADTKTRGDVAGSTRKLYRQKGTGRARQGSLRAPHRRGSGVAFGPHPRSYAQDMPKKMRRKAMLSVLSAKAEGGEVTLLEGFSFPQPKTRDMVALLGSLGLEGTVLIVTEKPEENVIKSARNLPGVKTLPASLLNIGDLLNHRHVLMTTAGLGRVQELWGKPGELEAVAPEATEPAPVRKRVRKPKAEAKKAEA